MDYGERSEKIVPLCGCRGLTGEGHEGTIELSAVMQMFIP